MQFTDIKQHIIEKNEGILEEIMMKIKLFLESHDSKNTAYSNLWDTMIAVLRGKSVAVNAYMKKSEGCKINNDKS